MDNSEFDNSELDENGFDDSVETTGLMTISGSSKEVFNPLNARQKKAVFALLEYPTIQQTADICGVNSKTVYRWLQEPDFQMALNVAEGVVISYATTRLVFLANKALDGLEDVLDNPTQDGASNKRLASISILDNLMRLREMKSIEQRLLIIEEKLKHRDTN